MTSDSAIIDPTITNNPLIQPQPSMSYKHLKHIFQHPAQKPHPAKASPNHFPIKRYKLPSHNSLSTARPRAQPKQKSPAHPRPIHPRKSLDVSRPLAPRIDRKRRKKKEKKSGPVTSARPIVPHFPPTWRFPPTTFSPHIISKFPEARTGMSPYIGAARQVGGKTAAADMKSTCATRGHTLDDSGATYGERRLLAAERVQGAGINCARGLMRLRATAGHGTYSVRT